MELYKMFTGYLYVHYIEDDGDGGNDNDNQA